jgi:hypothetical protein
MIVILSSYAKIKYGVFLLVAGNRLLDNTVLADDYNSYNCRYLIARKQFLARGSFSPLKRPS